MPGGDESIALGKRLQVEVETKSPFVVEAVKGGGLLYTHRACYRVSWG